MSKKESLDTISEDLEVLIHDENVSPELKIQNVEKVNEMLETKSRSGNLNL